MVYLVTVGTILVSERVGSVICVKTGLDVVVLVVVEVDGQPVGIYSVGMVQLQSDGHLAVTVVVVSLYLRQQHGYSWILMMAGHIIGLVHTGAVQTARFVTVEEYGQGPHSRVRVGVGVGAGGVPSGIGLAKAGMLWIPKSLVRTVIG